MDYVELSMTVADEETAEIIVAELADYPFESFSAEGRDLKAYIPEKELAECRADVDKMLGRYGIGGQEYTLIGQRNWNAVWESDFEPVEIDGRVIVRAPFHEPRPEYGDMELVIMPNMSFGTGHHVTTRLMVETMLGMELKAKQVLDMGCGTGVLAILAAKSGAAHGRRRRHRRDGIRATAPTTSQQTTLRNAYPPYSAMSGQSRGGITTSSWQTSTATYSCTTCRRMQPCSTPAAASS